MQLSSSRLRNSHLVLRLVVFSVPAQIVRVILPYLSDLRQPKPEIPGWSLTYRSAPRILCLLAKSVSLNSAHHAPASLKMSDVESSSRSNGTEPSRLGEFSQIFNFYRAFSQVKNSIGFSFHAVCVIKAYSIKFY